VIVEAFVMILCGVIIACCAIYWPFMRDGKDDS
jgi:hypothetical protein